MNAMQGLLAQSSGAGAGGQGHGHAQAEGRVGGGGMMPQPNMGGGGGGAGAINPQLAALFNSQQFAQIAQRMRENPSFY